MGHEQPGKRPVVVLSHDVFNERSRVMIAVAVSSQEPRAHFPLAVELTSANLPKRSWVKIGHVRTLSVERPGKKLGRVASEELDRIIEGLNEIIAGERCAERRLPAGPFTQRRRASLRSAEAR